MDQAAAIFVQGFMWKKICSVRDVHTMYQQCMECENFSQEDLISFVKKINRELEPFHLRISKAVDEDSGDNYYALINTVDSSLSRLSSIYTHNEMEFFKKIVECIVSSDEGEVPTVTVLNLAPEMDFKLSKRDADEIINKFSRDKWLLEIDGKVHLSALSILELGPYLRGTFKDWINTCSICKEIVLKNVSCQKCAEKFHYHCTRKYFLEMSRRACPKCDEHWEEHD